MGALRAGWAVCVPCCRGMKFHGAFPHSLSCVVAVQFQGPIYTHGENPAPLPPQGMIVQPEMHLPHPGEESVGHPWTWGTENSVSHSFCHGGNPFSFVSTTWKRPAPSCSEAEPVSVLRNEKIGVSGASSQCRMGGTEALAAPGWVFAGPCGASPGWAAPFRGHWAGSSLPGPVAQEKAELGAVEHVLCLPTQIVPCSGVVLGPHLVPVNAEQGRGPCSAALCPSPVWGCRETLEQSVLLLAATPGHSGFLGDIHLLPVTSRFTPPPDAPCHGKPRPLPPTSVHAPGPAPAAAAAHSDLLLRPWSDEFWESWLPLPPWSSAPSAPSSSLFQHAGKPGAPRLCPGQEQVGCCGVWGVFCKVFLGEDVEQLGCSVGKGCCHPRKDCSRGCCAAL